MGSTLIPCDVVVVGPSERAAAMHAQRLAAKQKGDAVRSARRLLLLRIEAQEPGASCLMALEAVEDPPDVLASLSVRGLLKHVRGVAGGKIDGLCRAALVDPSERLCDLSVVERSALCAVLRFRLERLKNERLGWTS